MCNCPTPDELIRSIDRRIDANRWQPISVGYGPEDIGGVPSTYSIGLVESFGAPPQAARPNGAARRRRTRHGR